MVFFLHLVELLGDGMGFSDGPCYFYRKHLSKPPKTKGEHSLILPRQRLELKSGKLFLVFCSACACVAQELARAQGYRNWKKCPAVFFGGRPQYTTSPDVGTEKEELQKGF